MSIRESEPERLENVAAALIAASGDEDSQLPSVDGVIAIACDLRELLFPGYRRSRRAAGSNRIYEQTHLLNRVSSRLRIEIGRALAHVSQAPLRLHNAEGATGPQASPAVLASRFLHTLPQLKQMVDADVQAAFDGDPAARTNDEIILCYPGVEAVVMHRMAHALHTLHVPYLPRILAEWAHRETGIDIHPGATIGPRFFVDHGTGVVIGETCEIGEGVTLYQGVTLGAWSFPRDEQGNLIRGCKRHPTLEDHVTVYSNATILGGTTIVGRGSQIGSNVTLSRSVPANTIVTIDKPSLKFREAG
ncbi:MAG: serine O-acetyltransferase EpsC [Planctomycetaceae bacterium]